MHEVNNRERGIEEEESGYCHDEGIQVSKLQIFMSFKSEQTNIHTHTHAYRMCCRFCKMLLEVMLCILVFVTILLEPNKNPETDELMALSGFMEKHIIASDRSKHKVAYGNFHLCII